MGRKALNLAASQCLQVPQSLSLKSCKAPIDPAAALCFGPFHTGLCVRSVS